MGNFTVMQRTQDGMFNATELLKQWNKQNESGKKLDHFFDNKATEEFINTIMVRENLNTRNSVYLKTRGIKGGTWMNPILFIDFSMWINSSFKYDVLKFIHDDLLKYRNDAGDAYREMASAIQEIVPKKELPSKISLVAKAINHIVFNAHETEIRNKQAEESKIKELFQIERDIAMLINRGFIKSFDKLIEHLRLIWKEKYMPKELT